MELPHRRVRRRRTRVESRPGRTVGAWLSHLLYGAILLPVPFLALLFLNRGLPGHFPVQGVPSFSDSVQSQTLKRPFLVSELSDYERLCDVTQDLEKRELRDRTGTDRGGLSAPQSVAPLNDWAKIERLAWRSIYRMDYLFGFGF